MNPPSAPAFAALWRELAQVHDRSGELIGPVAAAFLFLPALGVAVLFHAAAVPLDSPARFLAALPVMWIAAVGQGLIARIVLDEEGPGRPLWHALTEARSAGWRVLVVSSLVGLATLAGLFALIIPGFWLMARFAPAVPLLFAERLSPSVALGRAWELTRIAAGPLTVFFGILSVFALVGLLIAMLMSDALAATATRFDVGPVGAFAGHFIVQAVSATVAAAMVAAQTVAYRSAKRAVLLSTS